MTTKPLHQHKTLGYLSILNDQVASRAIDKRSPLIVRKLSFTCPVSEKNHERLNQRLRALTLNNPRFTQEKSNDCNYRNCISYQTTNDSLLQILWEPRNSSINFVKCELDTNELSDQCYSELSKALSQLFPTKFIDNVIRKKSRINKIAVELKLKNIALENIVLALSRCKSSAHVVGDSECHSYQVIGSEKCDQVVITKGFDKQRSNKVFGFDTDVIFILQPKKEKINIGSIKNIKIKLEYFFILEDSIKDYIPTSYLYMINTIGLKSALEQISKDEHFLIMDAIEKYKYQIDASQVNEWLADTLEELDSTLFNHNK
ncbi:TPA: hypothetical protein ACF35N_003088 [Vibrio parahaemolyticus]|uniref:hypothetical protein n=1 Tax=Vibrio parahaemolyticus TaxID=670 RepID=UPI00111D74EB|nr:hypothetical protein [Vibrio parahaemolyticus]TNZ89052.1 hypothetical protein CGK38_13590 [Vibrio parahaemolyticus]